MVSPDPFGEVLGASNEITQIVEHATKVAEAFEDTARMVEAVRANSAAVLRMVKSYRQLTNAMLAMSSFGDMSQSTVAAYTAGRAVLTVDKMVIFGRALAIPPRLFFDPPDDALRWVLENSPNPPDPADGGATTSTKWKTSRLGSSRGLAGIAA